MVVVACLMSFFGKSITVLQLLEAKCSSFDFTWLLQGYTLGRVMDGV